MKPVCPKCGLFFRAKKNGYVFEEGMPLAPQIPRAEWRCARPDCGGPQSLHGSAAYNHEFVEPLVRDRYAQWAPYKLWVGDLWECRSCGAQVVLTGAQHPAEPVVEHYMPQYRSLVRSMRPQIRVNDC